MNKEFKKENISEVILSIKVLNKHPYNNHFIRFIGTITRIVSPKKSNGQQKVKIPFKW